MSALEDSRLPMPAWNCNAARCSPTSRRSGAREPVFATERAGRSFLRFYGTFWSASHYPPPQCLLLDGQGTRGLLAPVQIGVTDASQNSPHHLRPAIADIHRVMGTRPALQRGGIVWVSVPWRDRQTRLLAIAHAPQDARLWGEDDKDSQAALACLLDPGRVDDYRQVLGVPVFQRLSLFDTDGQRLLGDAADASDAGTSWKAGLAGLQFRMRSERGWLAVYHVSWRQVFQHPQGPLLGATVVALLLALGGTLLLRAYRRSVIEPLRSNHARLLEARPSAAPSWTTRRSGCACCAVPMAMCCWTTPSPAAGWAKTTTAEAGMALGGAACWPLEAPRSAMGWPTPRPKAATCW